MNSTNKIIVSALLFFFFLFIAFTIAFTFLDCGGLVIRGPRAKAITTIEIHRVRGLGTEVCRPKGCHGLVWCEKWRLEAQAPIDGQTRARNLDPDVDAFLEQLQLAGEDLGQEQRDDIRSAFS